MRERAQATVETIALLAAALALGAALVLGVVQLGPWLAASIGHALSATTGPDSPRAPGLDPFERLLLDGATSPDADGPTLLDLQTHLRRRLDRAAADATLAANLRAAVARALPADASQTPPGRIELVDQETEDAWLRSRFNPRTTDRIARVAVGFAGAPGSIYSLTEDLGLAAGEPGTIEAGHAAGDLVVHVGAGVREVILRRLPGAGLTVVADGARVPPRAGVR